MSNYKHKDQRGIVSFMITLIMMLVITLIVLGFTQVSNRNRRIALDHQLNMQAFYAAESGINDAVTKIRAALGSGGSIAAQTTCGNATSQYPPASLNTDSTIGYSCILVDPLVPEIKTTANTKTSAVIPLNPVDGSGPVNAGSFTFAWSPPDGVPSGGTTDCATTVGTFSSNDPSVYKCTFGLLRVDLLKSNSGITSATSLANNTMTFYMQPMQAGSGSYSISDFTTNKAAIVGGKYDAALGMYKATINLSGVAQGPNYYARLTTLYTDAGRVTIDGTSSTGVNTKFSNAQVVIDVTGKARDVLRRVKVSVPLQAYDGTQIPEGAIHATADICKRFTVSPVSFDNVNNGGCGP